jgi:hypothetical protein
MMKRALIVGIASLFLVLPFSAWAGSIPAKVYENGANDNPIALSGVKVEVFGGYNFKALLSSALSGSDGGCVLSNVPLGKGVLVKLTKAGYVTQYDIRSYSDLDSENGVIFWTGSEANVKGLYNKLGESFNANKAHVYLDINDETTGEGVEGVQLAASSGTVFDFGNGEYLVANAEGASVKLGIQKPGYAFDIESATIPLFSGSMTQYYIKVQSGGAIYGQPQQVTTVSICGTIKTLSGTDLVGLSGVSVAFTFLNKATAAATTTTDSEGFYCQKVPVRKIVRVAPVVKPPITGFKSRQRFVFVPPAGRSGLNFEALRN